MHYSFFSFFFFLPRLRLGFRMPYIHMILQNLSINLQCIILMYRKISLKCSPITDIFNIVTIQIYNDNGTRGIQWTFFFKRMKNSNVRKQCVYTLRQFVSVNIEVVNIVKMGTSIDCVHFLFKPTRVFKKKPHRSRRKNNSDDIGGGISPA